MNAEKTYKTDIGSIKACPDASKLNKVFYKYPNDNFLMCCQCLSDNSREKCKDMGKNNKNMKCGYGDLPPIKVKRNVTPPHPEGKTYTTGLRMVKHCPIGMNPDTVYKYPQNAFNMCCQCETGKSRMECKRMGKRGETCAFSPYIPPASEKTDNSNAVNNEKKID